MNFYISLGDIFFGTQVDQPPAAQGKETPRSGDMTGY